MAAGAIEVFEAFKTTQMSGVAGAAVGVGVIDLAGGDLRLMLTRVAGLPVAASDAVMSDGVIGANEVSGSGYPAGGISTGVTISVVTQANLTRVKCLDVVIDQDGAGPTDIRHWVLYEYSGTPANDKLVCWGDFGADKSIQTGSLTIDFENTNGGTLFEY